MEQSSVEGVDEVVAVGGTSDGAAQSGSTSIEAPAIGADGRKDREVSAATVARMMGVATSSELKLLDGRVELLTGRVHNLTLRVEKVLSMLQNMPSGSDFERIDVQVASLRSLIKDLMLKELSSSDMKAMFEKASKTPESKSNNEGSSDE